MGRKATSAKKSAIDNSNTDSGEPLPKKTRSEKTKRQQSISIATKIKSDEDEIIDMERLKGTNGEGYNAKVTNFVDVLVQTYAEANPHDSIFNLFWDFLTTFREKAPSQYGYMDPTDIVTAIALHPNCGLECKVVMESYGFEAMPRGDVPLGATPLIVAAKVGVVEIVTALLAAGADVNAKDTNGSAPLHFAAIKKDVSCANELLSAEGIDIDAKDKGGHSPLFLAITHTRLRTVRALLAKGANPFAIANGELICLQAAIESENLAIVESIANVAGREELDNFLAEAVCLESKDVVATLIRMGGDVRGTADCVLLLHASLVGDVECARVLLNNGAELEDKLLLSATENEAMVREFLAQGVSTQVRDENGWTPLHHAARNGSARTIALLLARDTRSLNQQTWSMSRRHCACLETPLHFAVFYYHLDAVEAFLDKGAPTELRDSLGRTPLQLALSRPSYPIIKALISAGANIFVTFPNGMTTLHRTAMNREICGIIGTLVALGLDPEARCEMFNATPLLYAVGCNCIEAVTILIDDYNANLEARDYLNRTPLLLAVGRVQYPLNFSLQKRGYVPNDELYIDIHIIEKLLDAGACMEAHDEGLNTPLHIAATRQDWSATELLVARGANVKAENHEGKTPLQLWIESSYFDVCHADHFKQAVDILQTQ